MKKVISIIVALFMVLCAFPNTTYAYGYEYPVEPGSDEWIKFETKDEKVNACEIPEDVLQNMTTEDLLEAVLNYPLFMDMYFFNNPQVGFNSVRETFNGLGELLKREDVGQILLDRYKSTDVLTEAAYNRMNIDPKSFFELDNMEIILSQKEIIGQFDKNEIIEIETEVQKKRSEKNSQPKVYSIGDSIFEEIRNINESIDLNVVPFEFTDYVKTPNGTNVQVITDRTELSDGEKEILDTYAKQTYPNAEFLFTSTAKYNCHAYAWYNQTVILNIWMNNPSAYMSDGSYYSVSSSSKKSGDKIYYSGQHSGVMSSSTKVTSKWGDGPLMKHDIYDSPYTTSVTFWRR